MPQNCSENIDINDLISTVSAYWTSRKIPFSFSKTPIGVEFFPWSLLFPQQIEFPELLKDLIRGAFKKIGSACSLKFEEVVSFDLLKPGISLTHILPTSTEPTTAACILSTQGRSITNANIYFFKIPFWYDVINEIQWLEQIKDRIPDEDISWITDMLSDHHGHPTKDQILNFIGDKKISSYVKYLKISTHFYPSLSKFNILFPLICLLTFTYQQHWDGLFNSAIEIGLELCKIVLFLLLNSMSRGAGHIVGLTAGHTLSQSINSLFFKTTSPEEQKRENEGNVKAVIK